MASSFLENLKNAVDKGEFNSEAAKKIIEVDKLADTANPDELADRLEKAGVKTVSEEEAAALNSDYEKKMQEIREKDLALQQIAILKDIERMVMLSVYDMRDFLKTVEESFDKTKPVNAELFVEVEKIKNKYSSIINN
jgi:hypothetical protein